MRLKLLDTSDLYFTSDTHIGHRAITTLRGFNSVAEMDETIIKNWNEQVPPKATVIHCGDFIWHKRDIKRVLPLLNGEIILVLGNHDEALRNIYMDEGLAVVDYLCLSVKDQYIICCHYPFWVWDRMQYGAWHIHGHEHGAKTNIPGRIYDVGLDNNSFAPIPYARLASILEDKPIRTREKKPMGELYAKE